MWQLAVVLLVLQSTVVVVADVQAAAGESVTVEVDAQGKVARQAPPREMRGCFIPDTPVTMADGSRRPIRDLQNGDIVLSWNEDAGKAAPATVMGITRVRRKGLLDIVLPGGALLTTTHDHPLWSHVRGGLVSGDPATTESLYQLGVPVHPINHTEVLEDADGQPVEVHARLNAVSSNAASAKARFLEGDDEQDVITLCLDRHHWFFAHGVRVHNKGCFIPETKVTMGDGSRRAIEAVRQGDQVLSWDESTGVAVNATVMGLVHAWSDRLMDIMLPNSDRITSTPDHPFWSHRQRGLVSADPKTTAGDYKLDTVVELMNNTEVFADEYGHPLPGQTHHRSPEPFSFLQSGARRQHKVITLCLDRFHWFFAGGVRVHNKGCFVPDTPVTMLDGTRRPIGAIKAGDMVRSWDLKTGTSVAAAVAGVKRAKASSLIDVHIPSISKVVTSTPDHPYWSHGQLSLVSADPDGTRISYGLASVAMLNATEVFQDEHGRSVEGHIYRRDGQVQLLQGDGEEHGVEVVTLELERFHWFYVHGIRVHNKGGGGGGTISFCCCNNGFQWNGQACVQCPGTRNGTSTVDASASFTASDGGTPADFEPERRLDGLVLPFGADYHPMHLDLNCVDNVYIPMSNFWPLCGANQHTCQTPDRCCCNQNMEWRDGSCQACRPGSSTCEHNLAIDGSNYWFGFCQWSDGGSHSCYLPLEHSGLDNKYCCCLPHKVWDGNGCRPSPTPVSQEVIPGSNFWWMCNDWQGYYDCNAYGVTPKTGGWMGFFMLGGGGMILTFCLCCFVCGAIAVKLGFARGRTYQDRAESCKRQGHVTSPETCQSMASRDSSYRQAWICDRCNREFKPGVNEPFYRCQQCGVDFCTMCNDRPAND